MPGLPEQAVEDGSRRWRSGVCFDLPDGRRHYIISGPMHFQVEDVWQEIDNRWVPADAPWDYEMLAADYQARLLERFDSGQILRLEKGGHHLTFQPAALNFTNDPQMIQQISMPQAINGVVSNFGETSLCQQGRIDWADGYGSGLDFAYIPSTHFFRKLLTIGNLAALGTPEPYILEQPNPALSLSFIFTSDLDLYVDGELWDRQSRRQTAERIEFRDGDNVLHWWWGVPCATDANGDTQPGVIEVRKTGPNLYVSVRVPWEWLGAAVYPVVVDPDIYYGETTDAHVYGVNAVYATARSTCTGHSAGGTTIYLGQRISTDYTCTRGLVEFDTSGIVGAVSQANLYLTVMVYYITDNFDLEIMKYAWASPVGAGNREANYDGALAATKDVTAFNTNGISVDTPYGSPNLATAWIEVDGTTQYALVSSEDIAASVPTVAERLYLHSQTSATQAYRPYLSITEAAAGALPMAMHSYRQRRVG